MDDQMPESRFDIKWKDAGREPQSTPNPAYPNGIDLDASKGAAVTCVVALPYPAQRCGAYVVACLICGIKVACTTAGRVDDPRSIRVACRGLSATPS
jgi:hypothetical protein